MKILFHSALIIPTLGLPALLLCCMSLVSIKSRNLNFSESSNAIEPLPEDTTGLSSDCFLNGTLNAEERRKISLFATAKKIKIIAFSQKEVKQTPIEKSTIASKYVKDEVLLSENQIDELTEILYNYNYSKYRKVFGGTSARCYEPRHAIVFLNSTNKVLGYFELCFQCRGYKTFPQKENAGVFCEGKFQLIEQFFKSAGIKFFND